MPPCRKELIKELRGFVIDQIFDYITNWVGSQLSAAVFGKGLPWQQGKEFERKVSEKFCNSFDGIPDWLHLQVRMNAAGEYTSDGIACNNLTTVIGKKGEAVADFVLGQSMPLAASPHSMWISGDLKLYLSTAVNAWKVGGYRRTQFENMAENAKKFNFLPVLAVVSFRATKGAGRGDYISMMNKLHKIAKAKNIAIIAVVFQSPESREKLSGSVRDKIFGS